MTEFLTFNELLALSLPGLPASLSGFAKKAKAEGWRANPALFCKADGREGGGGFKYHVSLLPKEARDRLTFITADTTDAETKAVKARKDALWARFNKLSKDHKAICETRLKVLRRVEELVRDRSIRRDAAVAIATFDAGVQKSAYYEWRKMTEGLDAEDHLAALAPDFAGNDGTVADLAECHPKAWEVLTSDYLRPEKPAFSACYRRMAKAAKRNGWEPVPSERTLRRRMEADVGKAAALLKRQGKDKARTLVPAQRRSRAHFHAMQAVNMDGHKIDVFVDVPWSKKPARFYLIGIQDLYSGLILSHRLAEAETWEAVRLVIGGMVERYGIPETMYIDNGKAFASKWISGDAVQRFRFKVKPEDPRGLLTTLGINVHFTRPYAGQSKPIERAWRDLAEAISKHPFCSGAYTGNKPDAKPENYMTRAIPYEEFRRHVAEQIEDHNEQLGRRAENCRGRSFLQTFEASMRAPATIVRQPTAAQSSLWLLASEAIKTKKGSGEIHYQGNRYWHVALNQYAGDKVVIRFDPDALHQPVKVYDLKSRLICEAKCIENTGFDNVDDARMQARLVKNHIKAVRQVADAHATLTAQQLGEIYSRGNKPKAEPEKVRPTVTRLVTSGNLALAPTQAPADAISEQHFETLFSRALGIVQANGVIEFPSGNAPVSTASGVHVEPKSNEYGSGKKKGGKARPIISP
ncbi:transposase domain-containing protein [Rhizobium rhizogenes]